MTVLLGTYAPAHVPCAGAATPGAKALMAWHLGTYGARGATNLGVYGCRSVGGTTVPSVHGDGRACDLGIPVGAAWGQPLADWLHDHSAELGIQQLIYRRRIWSCNHGPEWHDYDGESPHVEHIHAEVTVAAGTWLTVSRINAVAGGNSMSVMYLQFPQPGAPDGVAITNGIRRRGLPNGTAVANLQKNMPGPVLHVAVAELDWYGTEDPAAVTVVDLSDDDIDRLAARVGDLWTASDNITIKDAVKAALREGVGTT